MNDVLQDTNLSALLDSAKEYVANRLDGTPEQQLLDAYCAGAIYILVKHQAQIMPILIDQKLANSTGNIH